MKKIIALFVCIFTTLSICAQTPSHIKFMGVPLTGTITQFHSKITAKGCKVNTVLNKYAGNGIRVYSGTFIGKDATIFIYYNTKTKIVYRAKATLQNLSQNISEIMYNDIKDKLTQKYSTYETNEHEGHESTICYALNSTEEVSLGRIDLFVSLDTPLAPTISDRTIHIDYWDRINSEKNDQSDLEEL